MLYDRRGDSPAVELYRKPDDRWEANEIANRCPSVAERLLAALDGAGAPLLDDDLTAHPR